MSHLTIVADDSLLQRKSRRARLSEDGWGICGESAEGEIVPGETNQEREPAVFNFPAPIPHTDGAKPSRTYSGNPRLILITVHQESRLLQYESHYRPSVAREPELAPVVRAALHQVVPYAIQDQAEVLVSQLSDIGHQSQGFYEIEMPDAIAIAVQDYRQRRTISWPNSTD